MEDLSPPLDAAKIDSILSSKFIYYTKLSAEEKKKFLGRTAKFISVKEFIPREGVDITGGLDDIKTLISAAAIQATFGLSEYDLPHFTKIFIYPGPYYSNITKHWHKGEANPIGALVFSWKDFKEGYRDEHDKINLGLHEMAHALMLSRVLADGGEEFFNKYFDKWWAVSNVEFQKLEKHQASFFRDYGGTNPEEFFAVCIEHFFEASDEFKLKHPEIYRQTCILLNQDPSGDFKNIADARDTLLQFKDTVAPKEAVFKTKGRTWMHLTTTGGLFSFYFLIVFIMTSNVFGLLNMGVMAILLVVIFVLIYRLISYTEFYVFENSFAIGFERHGKNLERLVNYGAKQSVSIEFLPQLGKKPPEIRIVFLEGKKITTANWAYDHIQPDQLLKLKETVKTYCLNNQIGYRA
jgi:Mlc titration factor MtfA (ptsG expression regulator)